MLPLIQVGEIAAFLIPENRLNDPARGCAGPDAGVHGLKSFALGTLLSAQKTGDPLHRFPQDRRLLYQGKAHITLPCRAEA